MVIHDRKDDVMTLTGQEISTLGHFAQDHGIFFFGRIDLRPSNPLLAAWRFVYYPFCWTLRQHNILDRATERNHLIQTEEDPFLFLTNRRSLYQSFFWHLASFLSIFPSPFSLRHIVYYILLIFNTLP